MSVQANALTEDHAHDHGHHHKETFVTKYIFSQDHKMISKQYLITGLIMGIIGIAMSLLFRMQLAWPGESFPIFEALLGRWAPDGVMDADIYLALVTIHGTIMDPSSDWSAGHGFRFSEYVVLLDVLHLQCDHGNLPLC